MDSDTILALIEETGYAEKAAELVKNIPDNQTIVIVKNKGDLYLIATTYSNLEDILFHNTEKVTKIDLTEVVDELEKKELNE